MKNIFKKSLFPIVTLMALALNSCYDEKMDWHSESGRTPITMADIPLPLQEQILRYDSLKNYATFQLGVGIDLTLYMQNADYKKTVDQNFDVITVGYDMKHAAMVKGNGGLDFTKVDKLFTTLPTNMRVFGHTLIWHQNQNVSYLNGLIGPDVVGPNLVTNGDLETGNLNSWTVQNAGKGISITQESTHQGAYAIKLMAKTGSSLDWDLQMGSSSINVIVGHSYELSFWMRSEGAGNGRISFSGLSNGYPYVNGAKLFSTSSTWTKVIYGSSIVQPNATTLKFSFDLGTVSDMIYYLDDIKLIDVTTGIVTEKTDAEKSTIIDASMKNWIYAMVGHYKNKVKAWDVVNEPLADDGTLRTRKSSDTGDLFYWQDYLGKDYAVKAFKYAREAGNANDTLFINDYNLESNANKLNKLIEYVNYIESNGAQIDGIGTQMHISINTDTTMVADMFKKLAATGKQIKISELDVKLNTSAGTPEQQTIQAEIYRKVTELYIKNIPIAQRYGITIWSVTDADSWIKDDSPCLWKKDYSRKVAYKGFADGLAGKDVGKGFSGELK